jgi:hypothetical protein
VATGTIITESLRVGATLAGFELTVSEIERLAPADISPQQRQAGIPAHWTLLHFELPDSLADRLASALANELERGWYVDVVPKASASADVANAAPSEVSACTRLRKLSGWGRPRISAIRSYPTNGTSTPLRASLLLRARMNRPSPATAHATTARSFTVSRSMRPSGHAATVSKERRRSSVLLTPHDGEPPTPTTPRTRMPLRR